MKTLGSRVNRLHRKSERAISKFLSTEKALNKHNEALDATISELDERIAQLHGMKVAATVRKQENAGIAKRIGEIVRGQ